MNDVLEYNLPYMQSDFMCNLGPTENSTEPKSEQGKRPKHGVKRINQKVFIELAPAEERADIIAAAKLSSHFKL